MSRTDHAVAGPVSRGPGGSRIGRRLPASYLEDRIARILLLHDVSNESAPTFPEIADLCESAARAVIDGLGLLDQWGVLLDDTGSMDLHDEESEARE